MHRAGVDGTLLDVVGRDRYLDRGLTPTRERLLPDLAPDRLVDVPRPVDRDDDLRAQRRDVLHDEAQHGGLAGLDVDPRERARLEPLLAQIEQAIRDRLRALEDLRREIELRDGGVVELIADAVEQ